MKIEGPLVDMLVNLEPERYKNFVTYCGMTPVLFVIVTKAMYFECFKLRFVSTKSS
jgi:hypothetical protein